MNTIEEKITVKLKLGLHARPSAVICQRLSALDVEEVILSNGKRDSKATGILDLMLLEAAQGRVLKARAKGKDAQRAIDIIKEILETDSLGELLDDENKH